MHLNLKRAALTAVLALAAAAPAIQQAAAAETPQQRAKSYADLAKLPDWEEGVWQIDWGALFGAGGRPTPPVLTPEAQAKLNAFRAAMKNGENVQNQNANCIPPGTPQIMQMPYPLEFVFSPGRVTIAIETDSQVRRIFTDGRKHMDDPDLTFNGDSIGHWEGKDLVVDTIGLEPHTEISQGVGHSDQVHIVERFHQAGPDRLDISTTITDPKILTQPWTVTRPYLRHRDWQIQEYVCEQNNHDSADAEGRAGFSLSPDDSSAAKPSAPAPAAH